MQKADLQSTPDTEATQSGPAWKGGTKLSQGMCPDAPVLALELQRLHPGHLCAPLHCVDMPRIIL